MSRRTSRPTRPRQFSGVATFDDVADSAADAPRDDSPTMVDQAVNAAAIVCVASTIFDAYVDAVGEPLEIASDPADNVILPPMDRHVKGTVLVPTPRMLPPLTRNETPRPSIVLASRR